MRVLQVVLFASILLGERLEDTLYIPLDHPAIQYNETDPKDPVAILDQKLESGKARLDYDLNGWGYLTSVLKQLGVPVDSQSLVFSRTSIQTQRISPQTPRAIYFNDQVSVGYVQGGDMLELSAVDPKLGIVLYTLETRRTDKPRFGRRTDCLRCHQGPITMGVPGMVVSSVHPRSSDAGAGHGSAYMTDHRTDFNERWGGWYVTGTSGSQTHLGNNTELVDPIHPGPPASKEATQNLTSLNDFFDTSRYLAPTSDIVALMTLEHQTRMTNLLTRIGWDARIAEQEKSGKDLSAEIDELAGYMLFAGEPELTAPVKGVSTFTRTFAERGPRDKKGRSLRDFDLQTRLFRYPLSYLIYSPQFDALPDSARNAVYQRLHDVLAGKDQRKQFARLTAETRTAILEILRETKPNLPPDF